jgi:signal transduction histidine kinase
MILKNLVDNAIKFTERGEIAVDVRPQRDGIEVAVTDTGIGIPADHRAAIFEPFRKAHGFALYDGVGLGLHIVKRLLDALGGAISVESEVGRGSCFRIWLPTAPGGRPLSPDGRVVVH